MTTAKNKQSDKHLHNIVSNQADSQQNSSGYIIAFLPFKYTDTYNKPKGLTDKELAVTIRPPIIVVNDAINVSVVSSKTSHLGAAQVTLKSGDVNYSSAIANGDHVCIWMFNNQDDYVRITRSINSSGGSSVPLNGPHDGLKFVGRITSVRQVLQINKNNGMKNYRFLVTMSSFYELESNIYFNELLDPSRNENSQFGAVIDFLSSVSDQFKSLVGSTQNNGRIKTEDIFNWLLGVFMGEGPKQLSINNTPRTPNGAYLIPQTLANYLGITPFQKEQTAVGIKYSDILHRFYGLQKYDSTDSFIPQSTVNGIGYQCQSLKGGMSLALGNFNNGTIFSILKQFSNPSLNELYTTLKYIPGKGVVPSIILRQIPLTTDQLLTRQTNDPLLSAQIVASEATLFSSLPRWNISTKYPIYDYNIGTSDAVRFNFVMAYTNNQSVADPKLVLKLQALLNNFRIDTPDILRTGPRIHTTVSDVDNLQTDSALPNNNVEINKWAALIADFWINGHLKMNGTITVAGIQAPICVGDNLQFDGKLFHIEGVQHQFTVDPGTGTRNFLTTLSLTNGYYLRNQTIEYVSQMPTRRENEADVLLPGFTDEELYLNDSIITSSDAHRNDSNLLNNPNNQNLSPKARMQKKGQAASAAESDDDSSE